MNPFVCATHSSKKRFTCDGQITLKLSQQVVLLTPHPLLFFLLLFLRRPEQTHYMALGMNYSVAGFEMVLTRKISFYVVTYYLPSGLFVVVSWISFLVRRGGEGQPAFSIVMADFDLPAISLKKSLPY